MDLQRLQIRQTYPNDVRYHETSLGQMSANDFFGAGENLFERHSGGVEDDGVCCGLEWGLGAVAVAVISLFQLADDSLFGETLLFGGLGIRGLAGGIVSIVRVGDGDRFRSGLAVAAVATDLGCSVQEDFDFGVGKDGGADVAAFHDDATGFAEGALLLDHPCAQMRMDGDLGGGGGDVGLADAAGDVEGVEQDAVAFELRLEGDARATGEIHERRFFVEGVVVFDGLEGEGAVHGTGLEVEEAEAAGEMRGEGAFAGAGWAVDGDDGALHAFLRLRLQCVAASRLRMQSGLEGFAFGCASSSHYFTLPQV